MYRDSREGFLSTRRSSAGHSRAERTEVVPSGGRHHRISPRSSKGGEALAYESRFVGREDEIAHLRKSIRGGGIVLVSGETGIGKTRLVNEALQAAGGRPRVWSRPDAITGARAYSVVVDLIAECLRIGLSGERMEDLLEAISQGSLGSQPPARRIAAEIRGLLSTLPRLPILVFEDLHDADELSLSVLGHLARSCEDDGILMMGVFRDEISNHALSRLTELLTRERLGTHLRLAPLPTLEAWALVREVAGVEVAEERKEEIVRLGEGIPFLLEELARQGSQASPPATVSRAILNRVDLLEVFEREVLEVAALGGEPIDEKLISAVIKRPSSKVTKAILSCVGCGLLREEGEETRFRHRLVSEVIVKAMVGAQRRELHRRLATALEAIHSDDCGPYARRIAGHRFWAGEPKLACGMLIVAADRALKLGALEEARECAEFGLALDPNERQVGALQRVLGEAMGKLGQFAESAESLQLAADAFHRAGRQEEAAACEIRASVYLARLDAEMAVPVLDQASKRLEELHSTPTSAEMLIRKGDLLVRFLRQIDEGVYLLREGLREAQFLGDTRLQAEAHDSLAWVALEGGDLTDPGGHGHLACQLSLEAQIDELIARTHSNNAVRLALAGSGSQALSQLDIARACLHPWEAFLPFACDHIQAWVLWLMGRPAEASIVSVRLEGSPFARVYGRVVRTWAAIEQDELWVAESVLAAWWGEVGGKSTRKRVLDDNSSLTGELMQVAMCESLLCGLSHSSEDRARLRLAESLFEAWQSGNPHSAALGAVLAGQALVRKGEYTRASEIVIPMIESSTYDPYPLRRGQALEIEAECLRASGKLEEAINILKQAEQHLRLAESGSDLSRVLTRHGGLAGSLGRQDQAIGSLKEALATARKVGAVSLANEAQALLRSLGVHSRAGRPRGSGVPAGRLSSREEEIVTLVAGGATNGEIARRLFLSKKTVENHIARAQRRLGVSGRAGLAAWAVREKLV